MNAHNEQHDPASPVVKQNLTTQPAAAQEAVAYLDIGAGGYLDLGSDLPEEQLLALPKGRHALGIIGTYGIDGYASAPVTAAPAEPDLDAHDPASGELAAQWLYRNGFKELAYVIRTQLDMRGARIRELSAITPAAPADHTCKRCRGSGKVRAEEGTGPDSVEVDVDCPVCGGIGVIDRPPAAPADASALIQDLRAAVSLGRPLQHSDVDEIERALASPPAAPGIDLEQFRPAVRAYRFRQQEFGSIAGMAEADRLLTLIDASPKGDETQLADATAITPLPMSTAPRDGTVVRLLVQFEEHLIEDTDEPAWTIGVCNDDLTPEDERTGWQVAGWCWEHDHFTDGKGTPVGWLPMLDSPKGALNEQFGSAEGLDSPKGGCSHCGGTGDVSGEYPGVACGVCNGTGQKDSPKGGSEAADHANKALAHLSNALEDLESSPDQRPVPLIREAMWHVRQMQAGNAPAYTTGHCENHKKPGGCPLHNLQCGYPQCDRQQASDDEVRP